MIEPMVARLAGCLVFACLLTAMIATIGHAPDTRSSDAMVAAEMQQRIAQSIFTRP